MRSSNGRERPYINMQRESFELSDFFKLVFYMYNKLRLHAAILS